MKSYKKNPASYRDPAGYVFEENNLVYRQVNKVYAVHYDHFISSGLCKSLVQQKKVLSHIEVTKNFNGDSHWYKTLLPEQLDFISYPYEWCFSQLKDAALLTLDIVKTSLKYGMVLKDGTPFNIQFHKGRPILIDTLSFEKYDASKPWVAYRQFVETFLAPLLLARYRGQEMLRMLQLYPDGIPLHLTKHLLPLKAKCKPSVFLHIVLQGMVRPKEKTAAHTTVFSQQKLEHIIVNLYNLINSLRLSSAGSQWNNYYEDSLLSKEYAVEKNKIVDEWLHLIPSGTVIDIGSNTGMFAQMAAVAGRFVLALDADIACIEQLYNTSKTSNMANLFCMQADIVNPVGGIGWENTERQPLLKRLPNGVTFALALVHHIIIGRNVHFSQLASLLAGFSDWLIIEFIPVSDPKVQLLIKTRDVDMNDYTIEHFTSTFSASMSIIETRLINDTGRILFLMKRNALPSMLSCR